MSRLLAWLHKLIKPVNVIGKVTVKPTEHESEFPLIASVQQVLYHTDPDDIVTDPVMKRKLLQVYYPNMDDLVSSVYNKGNHDGDHRPYAVSLGMYFKNQLPVKDQLERLMTALEKNPKPNLRTLHDVEVIVHVLTVSSS